MPGTPWNSKSRQMDSPWLDRDPDSVKMKRTASRKLSKCLLELWDTIKNPNMAKILEIRRMPEILQYCT